MLVFARDFRNSCCLNKLLLSFDKLLDCLARLWPQLLPFLFTGDAGNDAKSSEAEEWNGMFLACAFWFPYFCTSICWSFQKLQCTSSSIAHNHSVMAKEHTINFAVCHALLPMIDCSTGLPNGKNFLLVSFPQEWSKTIKGLAVSTVDARHSVIGRVFAVFVSEAHLSLDSSKSVLMWCWACRKLLTGTTWDRRVTLGNIYKEEETFIKLLWLKL